MVRTIRSCLGVFRALAAAVLGPPVALPDDSLPARQPLHHVANEAFPRRHAKLRSLLGERWGGAVRKHGKQRQEIPGKGLLQMCRDIVDRSLRTS